MNQTLSSTHQQQPQQQSKKHIKKQKTLKKQQQKLYTRKMQQVEQELKNLQDGTSQLQYQDPMYQFYFLQGVISVKRAIKWWLRFDEKFFRNFLGGEFQAVRGIILSDCVLTHPQLTSTQCSSLAPTYKQQTLEYLAAASSSISSSYPSLSPISNISYPPPPTIDKNKLRVMFKSKINQQSLLAIYSIQQAITNYQSQKRENLELCGIRIRNKFCRVWNQNWALGDRMIKRDDKREDRNGGVQEIARTFYSKNCNNNNNQHQNNRMQQQNNQNQPEPQKNKSKIQAQNEYQQNDLQMQQETIRTQPHSSHQLHPSTISNTNNNSSTNLQAKCLRLDLEQYIDDPLLCQKIQKIQQIESNMLYLHQIDKQLALWEWQLDRVNKLNLSRWDKMVKNVMENQSKYKLRQIDQFDEQIVVIRDKIYWATVLRSFQHGFKDKTRKMLESYIENQKNFNSNSKPPKSNKATHSNANHNQKKIFQTDCKICFCSDHSDSNQVLYCDNCNTSFHLACYGLVSVPQQQKYYCQRCTYLRKQQNLLFNAKPKKPFCQICSKISFPMKKIDDHFYHVTCLVIFNFVQFRDNKMVLKGSLTHENILKMVIENQLQHQECNYCRKIGGAAQLGMQIKCSYQKCQNYSHPICAYLNGCKFELKTTQTKSLHVQMFCTDHLGSRHQQIYLRRYMCNLNDTSSLSYQQFVKNYRKDQLSLINTKQILAKNRNKYPNRIFVMTRYLKGMFKARNQRQQEQIQTETKGIINRLRRNQN